MKIVQHLNDLLFQRDSVILPGFGEFKTVQKSAFRKDESSIEPPKKEISFNHMLKINDYVLAKYISEVEGTTISSGNDMIKEFVAEITEKLEEGKMIQMPGLGSFKYDATKKIVFEAEATNFDKSSFGLGAAPISKASLADEPKEVEKEEIKPVKEEPKKEEPKKEEKAEKKDVPPVTPPPQEPTKKERKRRRGLVWLLIIILLLTGAVVWGYFNQDTVTKYYKIIEEKVTGQSDQIDTTQAEIIDTTLAVEPVDTNAVDTLTEEIPEEVIEEAPETVEVGQATQGKYYVIVGCFRDQANAENLVSQLKGEGYPGAMICGQTAQGLYRVSFGEYDSQSEANSIYLQSQKNLDYRNAWIMQQ